MQKKPIKHKNPKSSATVLSADKLGLDKRTLPHSIVEIISTLNKAGFDPKDFDAVTNARPHEIKAIFGGRCRIIGKRFQLAHVYSGRELIEVATFRAPPKDDTHTTDDGMITRDNVWGDITQDFSRRDFSINALYYQPIKGEVLDFCGAVTDIKNRTLRLLGDAKIRIEEDPVRLLRALRFKAKLDFDFDKALAKQFNDTNWTLLEQVSAHRLYDETQKMFTGGYLAPLLPLLYQYGAMGSLMSHAKSEPTHRLPKTPMNASLRTKLPILPFFMRCYCGIIIYTLWQNLRKKVCLFMKLNIKHLVKSLMFSVKRPPYPDLPRTLSAIFGSCNPNLPTPNPKRWAG